MSWVTSLLPVYMFALMAIYTPGVMSPTLGRWSLVEIGAPFLLLAGGLPKFDRRFWLALALIGWIVLSFLWTINAWDTGFGLIHLVSLIGLGVVGANVPNLNRVWKAMALGVSVSLLVAIPQALGYPILNEITRVGFFGTVGLFYTSNVLGELATLSVIAMVLQEEFLYAVAPFALLVLSDRKECWLMLLAAIFAKLWFDDSEPKRRLALVAAALVLSAVFVWATYLGALPTASIRWQIWEMVVQYWSVLGAGYNTFTTIFPQQVFAHNEIVGLVFELGVGALLVFTLIASAFWSGSVNEKVMLVAVLVSAMVWAPFSDPATFAVTALLVGYLVGDRARVRSGERLSRESDLYHTTVGPITTGAIRAALPVTELVPVRPERP